MKTIIKLFTDDRGATAIEYAAIASLISVVAIGAMAAVGTGVLNLFTRVPSF